MESSTRAVLLKIREVLDMTQAQLAAVMNANINRIKGLESGRLMNLTREENGALVSKLNVNPEWLITGSGDIFKPLAQGDTSVVENISLSGFALVPRYDVSASAGGGKLIQSEQIVDHLAFREEWVHSMGLSTNKLALISVDGDSMFPTLRHRDLVLIDMRINGTLLNGIYAIQHKGYLLIKRLQTRMRDNTVAIISDNSVYETEILQEGDKENFTVIGRVVWFAREMG